MMQEIYQRGPIACGIAVPDALENYTGGIFNDTTGDLDIVHDISVVGYGVEDGTKYWVVRNSWGSHWGELGFFRVVRGTNNIAIESDCSWATPVDTWTNQWLHYTTDDEKNDPRNDVSNGGKENTSNEGFLTKKNGGCARVPEVTFEGGEIKNVPHAWEVVDSSSVPTNWDWRHVNGTNFVGWSKN